MNIDPPLAIGSIVNDYGVLAVAFSISCAVAIALVRRSRPRRQPITDEDIERWKDTPPDAILVLEDDGFTIHDAETGAVRREMHDPPPPVDN